MSNIINNVINNVADFDSICMNMTQAFQSLVSVAAKAETVGALLSIKEQLEAMMNQLDSEIDSHVDKSDTSDTSDKDDSTNQSESTIQAEQTDSAIDSHFNASIEDESTTPIDSINDSSCSSALT